MTTQRCILCQGDSHPGRFACHYCTEDLRRLLREIELYAAWLPLMAQPGRSGSGVRAPGFGSRPPVRLDVLVLLDPRSAIAADRDFDPVTDDDEDNAPRSVLVALESQASMIREELNHPQPSKPATISGEIGYLLGAMEHCAFLPWVDEVADYLRGMHRQLRTLVGDKPPAPLAPCMVVTKDGTCEGKVYWSKDVPDGHGGTLDAARCSSCNRVYYGIALVHLRMQGSEEAS